MASKKKNRSLSPCNKGNSGCGASYGVKQREKNRIVSEYNDQISKLQKNFARN
ncbi:hypothetical protein L9Z17_15135 [Leptospira noguchii]|nr:hypothetical protein [Leptospira noguchii]